MPWRPRVPSPRLLAALVAGLAIAQPLTPDARQTTPKYDLVIAGGHVIDPKNGIDGVRDVAVAGGVIAAVAPRVDPAGARTIDASGLYVTPGLVDIHTHVYAGTGERRSYAGDNSVYPDGFTFRAGVTTIADAGSSGWRNFEDFNDRVISRAKTRVLAFLNIVGHGMRGGTFEQDLDDMVVSSAVEMARRHRDVIVGIKTAHFQGPAWTPVERAVAAGTQAGVPVMVDYGKDHPERPIEDLVLRKLRPGDIYTHALFRPQTRAPRGPRQPRARRGARPGRAVRCRAWRRQLPLADCRADRQGGLPAGLDLHGPAHLQHERGDEGHAQRHEQVPGAGRAAGGGRRAIDVEPRAADPAIDAGTPLGRRPGRRGRAAGRARAISVFSTWTACGWRDRSGWPAR